MRLVDRLLVCAIVCLTGVMPGEGSRAESECEDLDSRTAAEQMVERFVRAWNADAADSLTKLFADQGTFTSPSGSTARGRDEIRQLVGSERQEMFRGTTLELSVDSTRGGPKDHLIAEGRYTIHGLSSSLGLVELSSQGPFQFTLQRRQCRYVILQAHTGES